MISPQNRKTSDTQCDNGEVIYILIQSLTGHKRYRNYISHILLMYKHSTIFETYWNYLNASAILLNTIVFGTHDALPEFSGSLNSYNK